MTYSDGTKATIDQEAHDVATFLSWAAEPKHGTSASSSASSVIGVPDPVLVLAVTSPTARSGATCIDRAKACVHSASTLPLSEVEDIRATARNRIRGGVWLCDQLLPQCSRMRSRISTLAQGEGGKAETMTKTVLAIIGGSGVYEFRRWNNRPLGSGENALGRAVGRDAERHAFRASTCCSCRATAAGMSIRRPRSITAPISTR